MGIRTFPEVVEVEGGGAPTQVALQIFLRLSDGSNAPLVGALGDLFPPASAVWSVDDPTIASVDGGTVTGAWAGETTVHVALRGYVASIPTFVRCPPVATAGPVPVSDVGTSLAVGDANSARCIAIDWLGRVHVTWFDPVNGLRYARSLDGGVSFLPSVELVTVLDAPAAQPIIGCGQEGQHDVYVVYTDAASVVRCLRSPNGGGGWPLQGVATGLPAFGQHSIGVRDTTVMIFTTFGSTMARSIDAGASFLPVVPSLLTSSVFNEVLMDPRGPTVVAISDDPGSHLKVSPDGGATFGSQVDEPSPSLFYSDHAIDQLGNVFAVSSGVEWVRVDVDAQTFHTVASSLSGSGNPGRSIAIDRDDVIHVVRAEFSGDLLLQVSSDQGATIAPDATLDTGATTPQAAASRHFPGVGIIYVKAGQVVYVHN